MFNLLMKPKPWIAVSLLLAASIFGQGFGRAKNSQPKSCASKKESCKPCPAPCPQPNPPTQLCQPAPNPCCPSWPVPVLNAGYNYPANTRTRCPWNITFDASFIYWQPLEDNLELAISTPTTATFGVIDSSVIRMHTDYKPGFKVGLGGKFDYDNWDLHGEYTWFHNTNNTSAAAAAGYTFNMIQGSPENIQLGTAFSNVDQSWHLGMDIGELVLGRSYYVGTQLTFHPTFGARGAWIRQKVDEAFTQVSSGTVVEEQTFLRSSTSWAVGPQVGLDANWMLSKSFRFYGCGEADILYTQYNRLVDSHTNEILGTTTNTRQNDYGAVRTHLDLELGFGWGMYFDCNKWYMDLSAGYGFQVFFDQNMFRRFTEASASGPTTVSYLSTLPNGNLYVQGLTVTFKLDF